MASFLQHKTIRTKATIYFALGFTLLWIVCNVFLYIEFEKTLWDNFDNQMKNKATFIANRTSINPRLVPLPEDSENFIIIHTDFYETTDTLFAPHTKLINSLSTGRNVRIEEETEDGTLTVIYSMSANDVEKSIQKIIFIFALALILELILAVLLGYWLSGKIVSPVKRIIKLADITDLKNNTQLLNTAESEYELKQLIAAFNRMLARIKEQSDLQNAFFASASHELRTPLSIMQTRIQVLLSDKQISDDTKQVFQEQLAEVRRMIKMVNDFLLMSELQNGNMQTNNTECDLSEMLTNIISRNKQIGTERNLSFRISFTPENETFLVVADEEKLSIILNNLIINSLKYAQENTVIDILLEKSEIEQIIIHIKNEIRKEISPNISTIKQSFYHSRPLHVEGSGLGLWIANRLSEVSGFKLSISITDNIFDVALGIVKKDMKKT